MSPTILVPSKPVLRRPAVKRVKLGLKKAIKFELPPADIALDNAIAAAARSLAARRR